jgi:hypothetical protein
LRDVGQWGRVDTQKYRLPEIFENLIGTEVKISKSSLRNYISGLGIKEADVGGDLDQELSHARSGNPNSPQASYFVIHDTSMPNFQEKEFPSNINEPSWKYNDLSMWNRNNMSKAHAFVNRTGSSISPVQFSRPWRATKFELQYGNNDLKGLFLHVELVQPRRSALNGHAGNDAIAPAPGFSTSQYKRLALLYVVASVRKGQWLIPAYHAVLDNGMFDSNDDPQNFELEHWAREMEHLIDAIDG